MFHAVPKSVRALIGQEFNEEKLEDAFVAAGIRQWKVHAVSQNGNTRNTTNTHHYITSRDNLNLSLRPHIANKLAQKIAADFKDAAKGWVLPSEPTIEDLSKAYAKMVQDLPDLAERFNAKFVEVMQPEMDKLQAKVNSGVILPWDHMRYEISRIHIPHLDKSKASPHMFVAEVSQNVLEEVAFCHNA